MKKFPVSVLVNCWHSVRFPPTWAHAPVTAWTSPGRSGLVQVTTNSWGCDMIGTVVGVAVLGVVSRELDYSVFVMFFFGASEVSTISTILKTKCR